MKDPRVSKLIKALALRFPGTTIITGPMRDQPGSGEVRIDVLDAPVDPPTLVYDFAWQVIEKLWGDEPHIAFVSAISPENSAGHAARRPSKPRRARAGRRRRAAVSARR
jgi:hypothetical protein